MIHKRVTQLILIVLAFLILVVPTLTATSQTSLVSVLILDSFQPRPLGNVFDPSFGKAMYDEIYDAIGNDLNSLQQDPATGISNLLELLENYRNELGGMVGADSDELCIAYPPEISGNAQGIYHVDGAGGPSSEPHGILVSHSIIDAVNRNLAGTLTTAGTAGSGSYVIDITPLATTIEVIEVDTNDFRLATITSQIDSIVNDPARVGNLWVINASFAIVPCGALPDLAAYEATMRAIQEYGEDNGTDVVSLLNTAITEFTAFTEPVVEATNQMCGIALQTESMFQGKTGSNALTLPVYTGDALANCGDFQSLLSLGVFVAAAGNIGLDYPFYPASQPEVVSVSASKEDLPFFSTELRDCNVLNIPHGEPCSNTGEVLLPGIITFNGDQYFGTSFATPRMSLRMATYMAQHGSNICGLLNIPNLNIPLADLPATISCIPLAQTRADVFQD